MQFIKNGPEIPERLIQEHEEGRVVFFCGAGVSYPARLPGFGGLVSKLYAGLGEAPNPIEQAAIDRGQFDTAIGLLEGRIVGGRRTVREQIANILKPDLTAPKAIATHDALLTLAGNREGRYRLITTNFDRLFEEVIANRHLALPRNEAPLLPVPKNRWDGLVYLHGVLSAAPTASELDRLVVSSGDFGLAYLTERWAARFVSELFRGYTVCFVGYSINDAVLRYMMDALAADRLLGESPPEMYAFGSYSKGKEENSSNEWRAKNVTPILYREYQHHAYLHRTLHAWAQTYRDGALGKERIVTQHGGSRPVASTKQDNFVGRMLWALSDPGGLPAKRFAELDPVPLLDWLEPLTESRFGHADLPRFGIRPNTTKDEKLAYGLALRPTPYTRASWMALVQHGNSIGRWDVVMHQLARWLARHLNEPKLILWIAKHGGTLHPDFRWEIARALEKQTPTPLMQTLWRLVMAGCIEAPGRRFDFYDWRERFKRDGLTPTLRLELRELFSPRVRLSPPYRSLEAETPEGDPLTRIKQLVNWEIVLNTQYAHTGLKDVGQDPRWPDALPELLADASGLLRDALDLMRELDEVDARNDHSYVHQPSISDHPQNRDFHDWTALIELARDAWVATAARSPDRARIEVASWLDTPYPLFRRLAYFAATKVELFSASQALEWVLADRNWWLWSVETQREALRLLVSLAPRVTRDEARVLEQAILQGPPREMFRDDVDAESWARLQGRAIWLRLAKCQQAGMVLSEDAAARLQQLSNQYPQWRLSDNERDEFPFWMGDTEWDDGQRFEPTPKRCKELVAWLRAHPQSDSWHEDDWRERCKSDFRRTAAALVYLARNGEWLAARWREALQAWADDPLNLRSWRQLGDLLATAPDQVLKDIAPTLSWWLQAIAKKFTAGEDAFFALIRRTLALYRVDAIEAEDDPVFKAINHPVGQVTDAALNWWYRQSLEDGQHLPEVLKPLFTDICNRDVGAYRHGRVLLAAHVITLFRVDGEWTHTNLLPLFDWQQLPDEAQAAWEGFLWSPRLYRPLMQALKPSFLAAARHYEKLGKHAGQYAALLTFAALEPRDTFTKAELAAATRALPPAGLQQAAQALVRALEGAGEQSEEYWQNRVQPYLNTIWPKSRDLITPAIADNFARLCVGAGSAFPDALRELTHWLQAPEHPDYVVHLLHQSKLADREHFPEESLTFLNIVVSDGAQWLSEDLAKCLDAIVEARPALADDNRYRRLRDLLRQRGRG